MPSKVIENLSSDDMSRADNLHQSALVVDSLLAWPFCMTEDAESRLSKMESEGASIADMIFASQNPITDPSEREFLENKTPKLWEMWERSGIDIGSHTIGVFGTEGSFTFGQAVRDCAKWQRRFDSVQRLRKITNTDELLASKEAGTLGIILNFQNSACIGDKLDNINLFYNFGIRVMQLTYNDRNLLGDGCLERNPAGLSKFGEKVIGRMNELGMIIDTSHCGELTTLDAIQVSDHPIAVTHSAAKAIFDHPRNKSDRVLEALAANNGYFGVLYCPFFLAKENASIGDWITHFKHVVNVVGAKNVGVCSDWARMPKSLAKQFHLFAAKELGFEGGNEIPHYTETTGLENYDQFGNITVALVSAGYSDEEIKGFLGGNWLRLFKNVCG